MTGSGSRPIPVRLGTGVAIAVLALAACGAGHPGGSMPAAAEAAGSGGTSGGSPVGSVAPPGSPAATDQRQTAPATLPAGPPVASLSGLGPVPAPGILGGFDWDGLGGEAPWIVGPVAGRTRPATVLEVDPGDLAPVRWQARWARISGAAAVQPGVPAGAGTDDPIRVLAPAATGPWSLAVTAWFAPGRDATWTWRVEVGP